MTARKILNLMVFALALTALPISMSGNHPARADDSETMNAQPENFQRYGNFPNQGGQYQGGWYQENRNQGNWNQGDRNNGENEGRVSRFSRQGRAERGGGGGGDD